MVFPVVVKLYLAFMKNIWVIAENILGYHACRLIIIIAKNHIVIFSLFISSKYTVE